MRKPFDAEHMQAADSDQRFWGGLLAATAALTVIKVRHHDQFVTILRQLSCVLGAGPRWRLPHYGDPARPGLLCCTQGKLLALFSQTRAVRDTWPWFCSSTLSTALEDPWTDAGSVTVSYLDPAPDPDSHPGC